MVHRISWIAFIAILFFIAFKRAEGGYKAVEVKYCPTSPYKRWRLHGDHCYFFSRMEEDEEVSTAEMAEKDCKKKFGTLFSESSGFEYIKGEVNKINEKRRNRNTRDKYKHYWYVGFTQKSSGFYYSDGSKVTTHWRPGYPKKINANKCVIFSDDGSKTSPNTFWNVPCGRYGRLDNYKNYVCVQPVKRRMERKWVRG